MNCRKYNGRAACRMAWPISRLALLLQHPASGALASACGAGQ